MFEIWKRFQYMLSPQFDIYEQAAKMVRGKVADIGSGTGFGTHILTQRAQEVHGFEVDEAALRFSQRVFPFKVLFFQYGDIVKGIDSKFDYVTMIDVLEHIKEDKQALKNVKAMLLRGGTFICSTPNRASRYRKSGGHVREYTPKELESLLRRIFVSVSLRNYKMEALSNPYENPILAVCRMDG
jgi:2-polyprenyl-3-methyl-5-hydroxy-6-metoxy-1,4-benzoquinol methylase